MSETVISTVTFPDLMLRLFQTDRIKVRIDNNVVTVIPLLNLPESPMRGFLSDGKLSTEDFMRRKQEEKELEL